MSNQVSPKENSSDNSFLSLVWEAVRGSNRDFTQGSVGIAVFLLAVPMILEMIMESIFAVVDVYFVAKLGPNAVAVVGLTESMMFIVYAIAMGIGIGGMAMVARRIGEKDPEGAAKAATHAIYLGMTVAILIGLIGILFAPQLLGLLGAEPAVVEEGTTFTRLMVGGSVVVIFLFLLNSIFRGAGDASIAMWVLWIANGINIVLDPILIFGWGPFPELGLNGAAVATLIGRGVGVCIAFGFLLYGVTKHFKINLAAWMFDFDRLKRLVDLSWVAVLQFLIGTTSWLGLIRVVSGFGSEAVAGYTIGIRIIIFALLPSMGLANAAATLVGQNLGAGKPERSEKSVWTAVYYNVIFQTSIGILFVIFSDQICGLFTDEPEVLRYATDSVRIISYGFFFYAIGMVVETAFNGAGDTRTPTYINIFIFWLFEIPLAIVLAYWFEMGPHGVFWAITIAFSALAIVSVLIFRRGKWKDTVVG